MGTVHVRWVGDMQFSATDSTNHSVVLSSTGDGVGMKPSDLVAVALGGCTAVDVVNILTKKRARLIDFRVCVSGEQNEDGWPRPFTKFHIHYAVTGFDLKREDVEKAIQLSEEKYCSVSATLRPAAEITTDFEIIDAATL